MIPRPIRRKPERRCCSRFWLSSRLRADAGRRDVAAFASANSRGPFAPGDEAVRGKRLAVKEWCMKILVAGAEGQVARALHACAARCSTYALVTQGRPGFDLLHREAM